MKRKIFTLLLSVMVLVSASAQQPTAVFNKASVDPVIDGVVDVVWAESATVENIILPASGTDTPTLGAVGETTWQGLWTDNGIYVLLIVNDDNFFPHYAVDPPGASYEYDKPELYFDCNYILADGLGPINGDASGHHQIADAFNAATNDGTKNTSDDVGVEYAFMVNDPDYVAEYFIPFTYLTDGSGIQMDKSAPFGFDVTIIDRDIATTADGYNRAIWANDGTGAGQSWDNLDDIGICTLDGAPEVVLIDFGGITLTGGAITEDNGTVQIVADILPADATNKTLAWSIENADGQTGKAKISNTGLVTGIADGDVTVWGKATDGSYEEASVVVNISGQTTTIWELNVIQNGTFEELTDDGKAMYWGGWTDASPGYTVSDGVTVHTPLLTDNVWQYQFTQADLNALPNVDYTYTFKAWANAARTFFANFEDIPANSNNRYGASTDPRANGGRSEWTFDISTEPTWYTFDVNFDQIVENTVQMVTFQLGFSAETTYIDSVLLVTAVEYDPTVSVPSRSFESTVRLYPNPIDGSNMLTVDRLPANAKVTIFDSVGRMVKEVVATQDRADFNVSSYARGVYFVRVNNEPVLKFVK